MLVFLRRIGVLLAFVLMFCFSTPGNAASDRASTTTPSSPGAKRPTALNGAVENPTTIRTDSRPRTDLTLTGQRTVRLWAHTSVDVTSGGRNLFLREGALFVDVPTGPELTSVRGASVAVDLSRASALFEYHPKVFKLLVLKGTARLYRPGHVGDSVLVDGGQLVFGNPNAALSDPVDFDIKQFLKTSRFISDFPALRKQEFVASEIQKQELEKSKKVLIETNLVMYGGGTTVSATGQAQGQNSPTSTSPRQSGP